jgi:hypothetical protein
MPCDAARIMKNLALLSLVVAPFIAGCNVTTSNSGSGGSYSSPTPSDNSYGGMHSADFDVSQMRASMSAQSDGTTIKVYASVFDVASDEPITLDSGDFFTATTGSGDPLVLVLESYTDAFSVHYAASLPAGTGAQDVTIAFVRQSGKLGAPRTIVHVPAPFSIVSTPTASIAYGSPLSIQVKPVPNDDILIEATGSCLYAGSGQSGADVESYPDSMTFDQNGNGSFDTSQLDVLDSGCNVSFFVSDVTNGTIDPAFAGGESGDLDAEGSQKRGFQQTIANN